MRLSPSFSAGVAVCLTCLSAGGAAGPVSQADFGKDGVFFESLEDREKIAESVKSAEGLLAEAKRRGNAAWPYEALRLMKMYEKLGRKDDAARLKSEILSADLRIFPQLKGMFDLAWEGTAKSALGAGVSRRMPRKSFYVSPDGNDADPGDESRPFATFRRARDAVRTFVRVKGRPEDGIAVRIRPGTYTMDRGIALGPEDSGTEESPTVWCADGDVLPVLTGGFEVKGLRKTVDPAVLARLPENARGNVWEADVADAAAAAAGRVRQYGCYVDAVAPVTELYENGKRLAPARWPDRDFAWTRGGLVGETTLEIDFPEMEKLADEPDVMATGFFWNTWADLTTYVTNVSAEAGTIGIVEIPGKPKYIGEKGPRPYFLLNALCMLSRPGEWFIDRTAAKLYVWPHAAGSVFSLSRFDGPFLSVRGACNVRIEGLVFECGRRLGVEMAGCTNCLFEGNVVRNFGGDGMKARDMFRCTFSGNVFRSFGHGALEVSGGTRRTLERGECLISGNEFSDVENRRRTYAPLLQLEGVGHEVLRNRFSDAPSSAMRLEGNDFYIVSNLVEKVLLESDDQGGVDIYFNASYFGNRYCHNVWRDIGSRWGMVKIGQAAVRFDGNISGQTVYANRFIRCGIGKFGAIQSCGGRLHVIDNNLFIDCSYGMSIDRYPQTYWDKVIRRTLIKPCLVDVCVTNPPYSTRYPGIADILVTNQVNHVVRNITAGTTGRLVSVPPEETVFCANRHYARAPDMKKLSKESFFAPIPEEDEVGPLPTAALVRARRADSVITRFGSCSVEKDNVAPADDMARSRNKTGAEIPLAPSGYRRPDGWKQVLYPRGLHRLSEEHSEEMAGRARELMKKVDKVNAKGRWRATGASIDGHRCPEWFVDAKLGIFIDWGLWSIPSWCPYKKGSRLYPDWYEYRCDTDFPEGHPRHALREYHRKNWGEDFKRDHFIDLFRASRFDAPSMMKVFRECGAKYVVPFLKHHSGFCLWDSSFTFRDVVDQGPRRDLAREMVDACRAEGLKFGFYDSQCGEWEYPILQDDGSIRILVDNRNLQPYTPDMEWKASGKVAVRDFVRDYIVPQAVEFIDKYDPDIFWGDYDWNGYASENGSYDIAAYMYNNAEGRKEVAFNDRFGWGDPSDYDRDTPDGVLEHGWLRTVRGDFYTDEWGDTSDCLDPGKWHPWESCSGISKSYGNHWMETEDMVMSEKDFICHFSGIVARGGNLLLLVNLDGQGAMVEHQRKRLVQIGGWLKRWGEAIYATRITAPFTTPDVDYTRSKDGRFVYAIVKKPSAEVSLACGLPEKSGVTVLGVESPLRTRRENGRTVVSVPPEFAAAELPFVLKCVR